MGSLVGQTLAHFRIVAQLGEGGMGVVYKATDEKLRRTVALKVLPDYFARDEGRRARFQREARALAAINHPNIATVYEVGEAGGRIFIAMEYVVGRSLGDVLAEGALPKSTVLDFASQIARALGKAHEAGVVHRDLKPDNIVIGEDGSAKLLDFGIAKLEQEEPLSRRALENAATVEGRLSEPGHIVGTPGYMAPEQALGNPVDNRTDLFSFGVIVYQMVTGTKPFTGATAMQVLIATAQSDPEPPSRIQADIAPALERLILRCLEKNPEHRYASAEEVLVVLDALRAEDAAERAPPAPPSPPARRWLVATLLVGALGVAAAYGIGKRRPIEPATLTAAPRTGPTALTDLPIPATKSPEAATEYSAGLQALRDNNWLRATERFEHAAALDPGMAAAHLRLAMVSVASDAGEKKRTEFWKAASLRAQLTPRDAALMEALEPVLQRAQEDPAEAMKRIAELIARYPEDVELYDWIGVLRNGDPSTLDSSEKAIGLDPKDGQAWQNKGMALLTLGRNFEARAAFEQCTAIAFDTSDCLSLTAYADRAAGRCEELERDARRLMDRAPRAGLTEELYAAVALGKPPEAVHEALTQLIARLPEIDRALSLAVATTQLAIVDGDFEKARAMAGDEASLLTAHPTANAEYLWHYQLAMQAAQVAREVGDAAASRAAARDFVGRSETWTREESLAHGIDMTLWLARISVKDEEAKEGFEAKRHAWLVARALSEAYRGLIWTYGYAAPALTPEEASEALRALPEFLPLTSFGSIQPIMIADVGIPDAEIGRTFLLGGKAEEAATYLTRAVASCNRIHSPFTLVRAALDLGKALEQTGDRRGACVAYQKVVAAWGKAKPRSISAESAKARLGALGCAK